MNKPKESSYNNLAAVAGALIAAAGLNYGNGAEAGDTPEPHVKWVIGLGLFLLGIWLFGKRRVGFRRADLRELVAGLGILTVLLGFSFAITGSGPSGLYQNDGYAVSGGILILYGGGLIGYLLGERRARATMQSGLSEAKLLKKVSKGGKK